MDKNQTSMFRDLSDPRFQILREEFLENVVLMLADLRSARGDGDYSRVQGIVHRLSGSAGNFGFPLVSEVAGKCDAVLFSDLTRFLEVLSGLDELEGELESLIS